MKKLFLLLLLTSTFIIAKSQDELERFRVEQEQKEKEKSGNKIVDTIFTHCGLKFTATDTIKAGVGSMPDGSFKYISVASSSPFRLVGGNNPNALNNANAMQSGLSGFKFNIHKMIRFGNNRIGFKDYIILKNGELIRYECDINSAIASGEIEVPEQYRPKQKPMEVVIKNGFSIADELLKLKKLLDDGILTKEEFEAQKKKLLERKD
jgi:hypothetical protein